MAQQDLIEKLLSKRRQSDQSKEEFFKTDVPEPFFVKNLETVQGDERDTIIFSVAYGRDAQGRLLLIFGPLNRSGGERRLNVAVTRAKHNIKLVSSMHSQDIDLSRVTSEGARLLRDYLDFAENGEKALERSLDVNPYDKYDSDFEMEVCEFLRSKGFFVDTQVGCSGYRIDLGLKRHQDSSDYVLAIECDGASYHSSKNARDRDRLRQEILESMGWQFYRIWSTDWYRYKHVEQERLIQAAQDAINHTCPPVTRDDPEPGGPYEEKPEKPKQYEFDCYKAADISALSTHYPHDYLEMVKKILEIESPLSEEFLMKRTINYFDRTKVTNYVRRIFDANMIGHEKYDIKRRNGFLYLDDGREIRFRKPGDIAREIKYIAPEELADAMKKILKENLTLSKNNLYSKLASLRGVSRVGGSIYDHFEMAIELLSNFVTIDGDTISLKSKN